MKTEFIIKLLSENGYLTIGAGKIVDRSDDEITVSGIFKDEVSEERVRLSAFNRSPVHLRFVDEDGDTLKDYSYMIVSYCAEGDVDGSEAFTIVLKEKTR